MVTTSSLKSRAVPKKLGDSKLVALNAAIAKTPKDANAFMKRGDYFSGQGFYEKAIADYQKAAKLVPGNVDPHDALIRVYDLQDNVAQVLAEYGKAVALTPPNTFRIRARADYLSRLGRNVEALADYDKATALNPRDFDGYLYRGGFYWKQKQFDKALLDYNKMVELNPTPSNLERLGNLLNEMKRYDDAIESFIKALAIEPKDADTLNSLGLAYVGTKSYDLAQTRFDEAIKLAEGYYTESYFAPTKASFYANRGLNEVRTKNWTAAQSDIDKSIALNAKAGAPYFYRALLTLKQTTQTYALPDGVETSITNDVAKAVQLDATLLDSVYEAANEYSISFVKQVALLRGATQGAPKNAVAWAKLGDIQRSKYAIGSYTTALTLDPKSTDALRGRAKAYYLSAKPYDDQEKFRAAIADWNSYFALKPNDKEALLQLGLCQLNASKIDDGVATFRKMIALNDDGTKAYAHVLLGLGLALQRKKDDATTEVQTYVKKTSVNQFKEAKSLFASAVATHPYNDELKAVAALIPDKTDVAPDYSGVFFV